MAVLWFAFVIWFVIMWIYHSLNDTNFGVYQISQEKVVLGVALL